jgi:hypothetical protein
MSALILNINANDAEGHSLFSYDTSSVLIGGSTDVYLEDGVKSPDFSLFEKSSVTRGWPTVVWEVAYSENEKKLVHDLARFVACSLGRVQLAIGVNIEHNTNGGLRGLKKVTCQFWEVDYAERFDTLEESGLALNCLTRCDEYADQSVDCVVPAATKFACVSKFKDKYVKFIVSRKKFYSASLFLFWNTLPHCAKIYFGIYRYCPLFQMDPV